MCDKSLLPGVASAAANSSFVVPLSSLNDSALSDDSVRIVYEVLRVAFDNATSPDVGEDALICPYPAYYSYFTLLILLAASLLAQVRRGRARLPPSLALPLPVSGSLPHPRGFRCGIIETNSLPQVSYMLKILVMVMVVAVQCVMNLLVMRPLMDNADGWTSSQDHRCVWLSRHVN